VKYRLATITKEIDLSSDVMYYDWETGWGYLPTLLSSPSQAHLPDVFGHRCRVLRDIVAAYPVYFVSALLYFSIPT